MKINNKNDKYYMVSLAFILYLSTIVFLNMTTTDRVFSESENRNLERFPKFSFNRLLKGDWTSKYEKYVADQFALRDFWIGVRSNVERTLGKRESNGVYLGREGQLIEAFYRPGERDLQSKLKAINLFSASIPEVNQYFMLVPNAVKILEDKLPPYAPSDDQLVYMEEIKKNLQDSITFIDLYDVLYRQKEDYIFYKTDHHWTTKGAFYAYQEAGKAMGFTPCGEDDFEIKKVTDRFYGSLYSKSGFRNLDPDYIELYIPKKEESYKVEYFDENRISDSIYHMENLNKKDKYTVFFNGNHPLIKITTNIPNGKKLLIIKDSYANSFIPFLTGHYSEIHIVDLRYYGESLTDLVKSQNIDDVLILYNQNTFFDNNSINHIS